MVFYTLFDISLFTGHGISRQVGLSTFVNPRIWVGINRALRVGSPPQNQLMGASRSLSREHVSTLVMSLIVACVDDSYASGCGGGGVAASS